MKGWVHDWRVSNEPSMSDHRIIRATLRGIVPNVVWYRDPKKTNRGDFRASMRRRTDGFKGKYGH